MERLTERHSGVAVIRDKNRHREAMEVLAKYEDTRLTPEQMQQLKERDTAKRPIKTTDETGIKYTDSYRCPNCGGNFTGTGIADYCYHCGQRLDWNS